MTSSRRELEGVLSGATIFALAGGLWSAYAFYWLRDVGLWPLIVLAALTVAVIAVLIIIIRTLRARLRRRPLETLSLAEQARATKVGKWFAIVNIGQGVAIFLAVQVCANLQVGEYFPPVVAAIVGVHFLVLAPIMRARPLWLVGAAMCLISISTVVWLPKYVTLPAAHSATILIWGLVPSAGSALVLWLSSGIPPEYGSRADPHGGPCMNRLPDRLTLFGRVGRRLQTTHNRDA